MTAAVKLTQEEFEALLFEVYKRGYYEGQRHYPVEWSEDTLKRIFDSLMHELKLKTIQP
jgi:hypothetical protein